MGLQSCTYMWKVGQCSKVYKISHGDAGPTSSVSWSATGEQLSVGMCGGDLQVWDAEALRPSWERSNDGPAGNRIGVSAWLDRRLFWTGSKDGVVRGHDLRQKAETGMLRGHMSEICGLTICNETQRIASGGNDNMVRVWDIRAMRMKSTHRGHMGAVKALAWHPRHHEILVTGGGAADRRVRIWDTVSGKVVASATAGSQVCGVAFSPMGDEFVTSHGCESGNLSVWSTRKMQMVATLQGHSGRVTYITTDETRTRLATAGGDETVRIWKVFEDPKRRPTRDAWPPSIR